MLPWSPEPCGLMGLCGYSLHSFVRPVAQHQSLWMCAQHIDMAQRSTDAVCMYPENKREWPPRDIFCITCMCTSGHTDLPGFPMCQTEHQQSSDVICSALDAIQRHCWCLSGEHCEHILIIDTRDEVAARA